MIDEIIRRLQSKQYKIFGWCYRNLDLQGTLLWELQQLHYDWYDLWIRIFREIGKRT